MREIKFRIKIILNKIGNEFYGKESTFIESKLHQVESMNIEYHQHTIRSEDEESVITIFREYCEACEVLQFTGLKDKNGTEIYEGDMFAPDTTNEEVKEVVRWDEDSAKFVVDSYDSELSICESNDLSDMILEYCEVIGSIHTTHDKGKKETR